MLVHTILIILAFCFFVAAGIGKWPKYRWEWFGAASLVATLLVGP